MTREQHPCTVNEGAKMKEDVKSGSDIGVADGGGGEVMARRRIAKQKGRDL